MAPPRPFLGGGRCRGWSYTASEGGEGGPLGFFCSGRGAGRGLGTGAGGTGGGSFGCDTGDMMPLETPGGLGLK